MHLSDEKFKGIFPFEAPRNGQREIIERIISAFESGKRYVILNAPTGIGKSAIGYSVARYYGSGTVLTSQKVLQEQYFRDFAIPFVLGRANYTCRKNEEITCEVGMCLKDPRKICTNAQGETVCPYQVAKAKCLEAPYSNLNYSYYLSLFGNDSREGQPAGFKEVLVCDECHGLEAELLKQYTVKIDDATLKFIGCADVKMPDWRVSDYEKCRWLTNELYESVRANFLYLSSQLKSLSKLKTTKEYQKFAAKYSTVSTLTTNVGMVKAMFDKGESIVVTHDAKEKRIEFKMLHCNKLFGKCMDGRANRFLFMSATILNYTSFARDIGLDEKLVEYIECDAVFPVKNRLIHFSPVGSMSRRNKDATMPVLIRKIDGILKENSGVKGIIHTVSYDVAERIVEGLSFSDQRDRLLLPKGASKSLTLEMFYSSDKPYILVSPALAEGIDLKGELSRLCIICKVPYANLGDKWTEMRMKESSEWYTTAACVSLIQMTGRSVRSETDFARTYILDKDFMVLAKNAISIIPKWWQDSVVID